jgi:hypothetical protein
VQGGNRLLLDGLDRYRMNVVIARRLEQRFRVRAIGLVAAHVPMHVVRRQQADAVAARFELPSPMMGRAARLEQDGRRRLLREVGEKSLARESFLRVDAPCTMRDRNLKHRLCEIDGDGRMLHVDTSFPLPTRGRTPLAR